MSLFRTEIKFIDSKLCEEVKQLKTNSSQLKLETSLMLQKLETRIDANAKTVDRIFDERCTGTVRVRGDLKTLREELYAANVTHDQELQQLEAKFSKELKALEKKIVKTPFDGKKPVSQVEEVCITKDAPIISVGESNASRDDKHHKVANESAPSQQMHECAASHSRHSGPVIPNEAPVSTGYRCEVYNRFERLSCSPEKEKYNTVVSRKAQSSTSDIPANNIESGKIPVIINREPVNRVRSGPDSRQRVD